MYPGIGGGNDFILWSTIGGTGVRVFSVKDLRRISWIECLHTLIFRNKKLRESVRINRCDIASVCW